MCIDSPYSSLYNFVGFDGGRVERAGNQHRVLGVGTQSLKYVELVVSRSTESETVQPVLLGITRFEDRLTSQ